MKRRWHKSAYILLGMMCLNLLAGPRVIYGAEANEQAVSKTVITEGRNGQPNQVAQNGQGKQDTKSEQVTELQSKDQGNESSQSNQNIQKEQGSQNVQEAQNNQGGKSGKQQEASDPTQVCLTLVALFGIGSFAAVLSSVLYKLYVSKKVVALPVLYYGNREEGLHE